MSDRQLEERFTRLWGRLGGSGDGASAFRDVYARWNEPHRRYHGLDHLRDCLAQLDSAPPAGEERALAEAALWYHDAVYRPGAPDNEARSAELARAALEGAGVPGHRAAEVDRLIRATDHAAAARDPAAALVCDVDLSILGRKPDEFAEYERRIREEYRDVPEPVFQAGRARILSALLARDPLYRTGHFRARYETAARRNLRESLWRVAPEQRT